MMVSGRRQQTKLPSITSRTTTTRQSPTRRRSTVRARGRAPVKLGALRRRSRGERAPVKLGALRRRSRGERAPVKLGALCPHSGREDTTMPAERRFGMDHEHYDWSPIATRGVLHWPEQARLALCVVVNLEHTEWLPPADSFRPVLTGGVAARPYPDYALLTHREYGHRVGVFRVLDVLEKHCITP